MAWRTTLYFLATQPVSFNSGYAIHVNPSVVKFVANFPYDTQAPQVWRSCFKARIWSTLSDAQDQQTWFQNRGVTTWIMSFTVRTKD
jgi:hypothetical protein